jgi:phosphoserine aminotransferase
MTLSMPPERPANPRFSSGPCAKPPGWTPDLLHEAVLGRSHRGAAGKARLKLAIELTRAVLEVPATHRIGIVPASDTGAVEMAMWTMLGARPVEMLAWDAFGETWVTDAVAELRLEAKVTRAAYGRLPDLAAVDWDRDVVFTWNGTTSGVRVPEGFAPPAERQGLAICDATSAAFAQALPWDALDVATFSWQKALGGEAAHGMLVLGPRAVERLETFQPDRPLPKIFRLTSKGRLIEGIFEGETINTPSMLCVEDWIASLRWAQGAGGLSALVARADANARVLWEFCDARSWIANLAADPATRSNTSVCLRFTDGRIRDGAGFAKAVARRLEGEGAGFDLGAYRDAPPGLRIWCGATVERADLEALLPWLDWAFAAEIAAQTAAA